MSTENTLPETDEVQLGTEVENDLPDTETPENEEEVIDTQAIEPEVVEKEKVSGFKKRIQKFEGKLAEKDRELEFYRRLVLEKEQAAAPTQASSTLKLEDFGSIEEYVAAQVAQVRNQVLQEVQVTAKQTTKQAQVESQYLARIEKAKEALPDWDEVFENLDDDTRVAPDTAEFCFDSEVGPQISYYLAKNPDFNDRLNGLSAVRRIAELGKLEDKLSAKSAPKKVTAAPAKVSTVKGSATATMDRATAAANGDYRAWKAARDKEAAAKRK